MICSSIDVIIQAARLRDGSRRITHITEVMGMEGDVIITQDLIIYEIIGEDANGKLIGRHRSTGIGRPRFWERARYYGEEQRLAAALDALEARRSRCGLRAGEPERQPWIMSVIAVVVLATLAAGGVVYALFYPMLSGQARAEKRRKEFASAGGGPRRRPRSPDARQARPGRPEPEGDRDPREGKTASCRSRSRILQAGPELETAEIL